MDPSLSEHALKEMGKLRAREIWRSSLFIHSFFIMEPMIIDLGKTKYDIMNSLNHDNAHFKINIF